MYVFLLDELSGGLNARFEIRKDLDDQLDRPFVVSDEDEDERPGVVTKTQDRKAKEEIILERWREEQRQRTSV